MSRTLDQITNTEQLAAYNMTQGYYFFSRETMRCFRSRVCPELWHRPEGIVFITSEQFNDQSPRLYTARIMNEAGNVNEFAGCSFQQFDSKRQAVRFIENVIKMGK